MPGIDDRGAIDLAANTAGQLRRAARGLRADLGVRASLAVDAISVNLARLAVVEAQRREHSEAVLAGADSSAEILAMHAGEGGDARRARAGRTAEVQVNLDDLVRLVRILRPPREDIAGRGVEVANRRRRLGAARGEREEEPSGDSDRSKHTAHGRGV
jgi:hypothetical protein